MPNKLGKYSMKLYFTFSKESSDKSIWTSSTSTVQDLYVLYDKPKYGDLKDTEDLYRGYRLRKNGNSFVKRNINEVFKWLGYYSLTGNDEDYADKINIATKIHDYIVANIRKFNINHTVMFSAPFEMIFNPNDEGYDCISHAMLMSYGLNILGIKATIKCIGAYNVYDGVHKKVYYKDQTGVLKGILCIEAKNFNPGQLPSTDWEAICHVEGDSENWDDDMCFDTGMGTFVGTLFEFRKVDGFYIINYHWKDIHSDAHLTDINLPEWVLKLQGRN